LHSIKSEIRSPRSEIRGPKSEPWRVPEPILLPQFLCHPSRLFGWTERLPSRPPDAGKGMEAVEWGLSPSSRPVGILRPPRSQEIPTKPRPEGTRGTSVSEFGLISDLGISDLGFRLRQGQRSVGNHLHGSSAPGRAVAGADLARLSSNRQAIFKRSDISPSEMTVWTRIARVDVRVRGFAVPGCNQNQFL